MVNNWVGTGEGGMAMALRLVLVVCTLCGTHSVAMFCFVIFRKFPVTNWAAQSLQYQLNGRWNMTKMLSKISQFNGSPTVYIPVSHANPVAVLLVNTGVGVGG